ncbi:hypothetical protein F5Y09DRAFT_337848 [Xylaria sp. FL1042]|nr:hypothetical protein F5Y09DRAFT_337848 [Xylaria sp. FL1042]
MAKKTKSRVISVRLLSMAMTGFFYQYARPRTSRPMSMLKYDPVGMPSHISHHRSTRSSGLPAPIHSLWGLNTAKPVSISLICLPPTIEEYHLSRFVAR